MKPSQVEQLVSQQTTHVLADQHGRPHKICNVKGTCMQLQVDLEK
jgi:hypothetical protein